ncbi:monovalent cation:proton antiporter-2 (CPA2) family protein [Sandaracinus amylolyticus]|uniref:monovalent cation:proton antiporter-2 (CPA2) family protein n=1 Tax=Sandaracinus amylolyticus TaxID=927083 RepID=UPI001F018108|nr:monovalent cation:proton antiporter-2 (CPA2) family protein [Sandaracinus amylolyticus]UJR80181.1 Glutathione-regulated potassium-efflux system ancillary protein KefC/glutathione-regulated potassium-efflux system protein KefB [Sandaracinus amylolyticus]
MLALTAIFLAAAVVAVPVFKRLGLGSVLGYLVGGAIIGPSGLGLVEDVHSTLHFAEFGVVLLLFIIGLELQPARLWRMRGAVFGLGGAQVLVTAAVVAGFAIAFGIDWRGALVAGLALAMSSTALATQMLGEKHEMGTTHGRAAFGVLLFQDVAAIPLLAIVPMLGAAPAESGSPWLRFGIAAAVIAALVFGGRLLLRPMFRLIAQVRSHELSVASALLVVIATAILMEHVGLSMALGAFIAGVLLADSEYRHELEANIEPFKGLLLGLFFMAVGMSANLGVLLAQPLLIVGLALALVAVKLAVLVLLARASGHSTESSASLGIAISQGGEFAFVIFGVATQSSVMSTELVQVLVMVVTLSMAITPLLFLARDRLQQRLERASENRAFDEIEGDESQVIIAGFGRFGQIVGRVLRLRRIPFTALDVSPEHVDFLRRFGNKIHYGDASRLDLLRAARADSAKVLVLAIDDVEASMRTLHLVKEHFPHLKVIARARNRQHAYALLGAGVDTVIRETFAGSVEAARHTLEELGLAHSDAKRAVRRFAEYDERMVREMFVHREDEKKLIESAKVYGKELERIFDDDARSSPTREAS